MNIAPPREDYTAPPLVESDVHADPIVQFGRWFAKAVEDGVPQPNAMTLATATPGGSPSARMVLLKDFDARGFVFYTNYESRKARELDANPRAALVFYWYELHRQVRIAGRVERVSREESETYFATRPAVARLGAIASRQSAELGDRRTLEERVRQLGEQYPDGGAPLPDYWGGYRVTPDELEFWQGRENRLHDRLRYSLSNGVWRLTRLYP
jgi:pyridoxamine 5'-phosphate oxidase